MSFQDFVASLTPEVVANLRRGVELGKWPDGRPLTPEQREQSLEAVLAWEAKHLPEDQRTGYMSQSCKSGGKKDDAQEESILRFQDA
ncbi:YeaC family protein [Parendozoicomonas haliclonae]|uniref:DUF1315 domain-containing protein n=1 Tax=Parendozoicomonas haliclonae TaxID=1960125 RepID=A0A1X7AMP4_9GAMM|nr:DUF1315 family protein [Parendozoicomonas haliclonae]SMA49274.1 hypothetical protein EHSB41UT_03153 [Parendozoicomonas haliclonae]